MPLRQVEREALEHVASLVPGPPLAIDELSVHGSGGFASAFDVDAIAVSSAAAANLAAGVTEIDRDRVVASYIGLVEVDGEPLPKWADLSGYYQTSDSSPERLRFIQFHCNFPHHAAGVVKRLGCEATRESIQEAVLDWDPIELESALIAGGMIAARLRALEEWEAHPHAQATAGLPLISVEQIGEAPARDSGRRHRVLDCSRVLAGPVAGQTMAAHGADVLRIGSPSLPSVDVAVVGTGFGKRNAYADLDTNEGRSTFTTLLGDADVWIDAYRPESFAKRGYPLDRVAPGSVTVQLCAFDWVGPWADRRGFDSIVQSTTGIVEAGRAAGGRDQPTPLPVQALDFATGYLAAYAATRLLAHQAEVGGTWLARLSLLRTRNWLVSLGGPSPFEPLPAVAVPASLGTMTSPFGEVTAPLPIAGSWTSPPQRLGSSPAVWL